MNRLGRFMEIKRKKGVYFFLDQDHPLLRRLLFLPDKLTKSCELAAAGTKRKVERGFESQRLFPQPLFTSHLSIPEIHNRLNSSAAFLSADPPVIIIFTTFGINLHFALDSQYGKHTACPLNLVY